MINIRIFCTLLMLLSLVACDDKASSQGAKPAARAQQDFAVNNVQAFQGIEQLKAKLLMNPTDFATLYPCRHVFRVCSVRRCFPDL